MLYVLARLRLPLISLNTFIRHRSCAPEDCSRHSAILPQGPAPVSCVFPAGDQLHLLEIKVSCNQAIAISRGSPGASPLRMGMTTGFLACYFSLHFSVPGQPSDPEIYLQSLLAVRGIQICASWRSTVLIPFATRPAHPMYCRLTPAVASPAFSCPVSSIAPITSPPRRPARRAASSRPATANRRISLIAAKESQTARFSSRCVLSGHRSPACWAIVHPFRSGSSLTSAATYFPACSHGPVRAKHDLSAPSSSTRSGPRARPLC